MSSDLETAVAKELASFSREDWDEMAEHGRKIYLREAAEIIAMVEERRRASRPSPAHHAFA